MRSCKIHIFLLLLTLFSCKKEDEIEKHTINISATSNDTSNIKADFELFFNASSPFEKYFFNKSKNFNKATWYLNDTIKSNEINPLNIKLTSPIKKVKLVVENSRKQKDSLTILFNTQFFAYRTSCEYFLTDIQNVGLTVYRIKMYAGDGIFSYSLGEELSTQPTPFIDSFKFNSYKTSESYFITYYSENKITLYQKQKTINLKDFYNFIPDLGTKINITNRFIKSGLSDPITFKDTALTIHFNNGFIELIDSTLEHSFRGYLSSYSASNTFNFSMPNKQAGTSGLETEYISFSKTNNYISAQHKWYPWSEQYSTIISYSGTR